MSEVTVKLSQSYENPFDQTRFDSITLREPRYADVFADGMGPPYELQPNGAGGVMVVTHYELINRYIARLATKPTAEVFTSVISGRDAMALSKAVTDFFTETPALKTTPIGSSSAAESPQT